MSFSITGPSSVTVNVPADYPQVSAASFRAGSSVSGMEFVQSNGSRVLQILVDAPTSLDQDIGAGDFTWWVQFSVPASLTGNAGIAALTPNNMFCIPSSGNSVAIVQQNSDIELVFGNVTNNTRYPLSLSGRTGQIVDVTITRSGGSLAVYIDGAQATVAATNTGTGCVPGSTFNTDFAITGGAHSSGNPNAFAGIVFRHVAFNYALAAARVLDLVRLGVDISDQWGSKKKIIDSTTRNGSFTSFTGSSPDQWVATNYTTANLSPGLRLTAGAGYTNNFGSSLAPSGGTPPVQINRRYMVSVTARQETGPGSLMVSFSGLSAAPDTFTHALTGSFQTFTSTAVATASSFFLRISGGAASVSAIDISNVELTRLGAFFDLSFSDIYGFQADDRSDNELNGRLIGSCGPTLPGTHLGKAQDSLDSNGGEQLFGAQCIPTNALIESILVENISVTGTPTVSIGTTSGGTQVANAVAIGASGTTTQIVPSVLFSSTGNLWFAWSASGVIWVTVLFRRI